MPAADAAVLPTTRAFAPTPVRFRSRNRWAGSPLADPRALATAVGGGGVLARLLLAGHTLGVSPDSATYLSAARSLARRGSYADFTHLPLSLFPPGYSGVVALGIRLGLSAEASALTVNMAALGVLAGCSTLLLRRVTGPVHAAVGGGLVASIVSVRSVLEMAWSESLFLALLAAVLVLATRPGMPTARHVALLGGLAAALTLTRWVGLAVAPVLVASLILRPGPLRRRLALAGLLSIALLGPVLVWVLRDAAVAGSAFGPRPDAVTTWTLERRQILLAVHRAVAVHGGALPSTTTLIALGAGAVMCAAGALRLPGVGRTGGLLLGCAGSMLAAQMVLAHHTAVDPLSTRLLAPEAYVAVLAAVLLVPLGLRTLLPTLPAALGVALGLAAVAAPTALGPGRAGIPDYHTGVHRDVAAPLVSAATGCRSWVSDDPYALGLVTDDPVTETPRTQVFASADVPHDWPAFLAQVASEHPCAVLFGDADHASPASVVASLGRPSAQLGTGPAAVVVAR